MENKNFLRKVGTTNKSKFVLLVDTHHLLYRLYFSTKNVNLSSPRREKTTLLFIFIRTVLKLLRENRYYNVVFCFDSIEKTARHAFFDKYKSHRPIMPYDMIHQLPFIFAFLNSLSIPGIHVHTFEADDIIATLANFFKKKYGVHILSNDKDFIQLIDEKVSLIIKEKQYYRVINGLNVDIKPKLFVDYRSLVGDKSDNIPGAKGIGRVVASNLLEKYGSVKDILKIAGTLDGRVKKILTNKEQRKNVLMSRELIQLNRDLPLYLPFSMPKFSYENLSFANSKLREFLEYYQIKEVKIE